MNCIDQHMHFQSTLFLSVTLWVATNALEYVTEQAYGSRIDQKNLLEGQSKGSAVRQKRLVLLYQTEIQIFEESVIPVT